MTHKLSAIALSLAALGTLDLQAKIGTELIGEGFDKPVWARSPEGVEDMLWVLEKPGVIQMLDTSTGEKTEFLDIRKHIKIKMNEQGLLGLAFEKDYLKSGRFYVYYTNQKGDTEICRFTAHGDDKRQCDADTRELLITFKQDYKNHNGGWIGFGPDGYLYIGTGDGGAANDPNKRAQDLSSYLGKLLRIDVSPKTGYKVPNDNPFTSNIGAKTEIYSYGLRNPWRCSWDRKTGDFYIADVGQNHWEEINFMPAGQGNGANYGWRLREGDIATPKKKVGGSKPENATDPVYVYKHGGSNNEGFSITGGYVYRGPIKSLQGKYFFADYANPRVWSIEVKDGKSENFQDWTDELKPSKGSLSAIASFGEDHEGNLLIISHSGQIYQVVDQ
ncbi:PQQ-dependent sugar dehydrogenase [Verrucomicrobiaceae bacterium R5-34]|uniref:PQQ-dependent sugar dehydrogenase n=1 Tax=Oceaniferula flava TaxID=2800421 RepID=A0AAE2VC60_9BACT|nr:PQQ-dependent sugar dehydrogenase [Oceaniferula flavus]MBK1830540.1 PQQ-dependent sugar dehydrogenase [Verrucomicrobiaceae bacterium R5-34]MBK1854636.1 PQQ-dependent sugar dehydrogenase [Oceaniferula flavus]MBM1135942.1 PQQ-dependent sugar dehydrogenase [Oceaniferula flavus]